MIECLLCGAKSSVEAVMRSNVYQILYCSICQLQFCSPMIDHDSEFYRRNLLYRDRSDNIELDLPRNDWRYKTAIRTLDEALRGKSGKLLDIGCGDGGFMALVKNKGFDVFGIDVDERAIQLAEKIRNLKQVRSGSWKTLQEIQGPQNFDVITAFDMVEHVSSPVALVKTAYNLLKPGGLLVITVPRLDRYPKLFDVDVDFPPHHYTIWTNKSLSALFTKAGFSQISIREKPLTTEDVLLHFSWRTKRLLRKLRGIRSGQTAVGDPELHHSHGNPRFRLPKKAIWSAIQTINWFLRSAKIGRGHTVLGLAKK